MKPIQDNSDKILRDKINSLDALPEGYAPSLDSKWELLMTGMQQPDEAKIVAIEEKKEKRPFFYMYATAACFLALFTFGWLFLKEGNLAGNQVAVTTEKAAANKPSLANNQTAPAVKPQNEVQAVENEKPLIAQAAEAKKVAATTQTTTTTTTAPVRKQSTSRKAGVKTDAPTNQYKEETVSAQPDQLLAHTAPVKPAKAKTKTGKKARSIELDFEAEKTNLTAPAQHNPQVAQQNLKFKFFPISEPGSVAQHDSPVKVQRTF